MDLRSLALELPDRRARLGVADAAGERTVTIEGEGYERLEAAAAVLLAAVEARLGGACHLGLEALAFDERCEVTVTLSGGEVRRFSGVERGPLERGVQALARAALGEASAASRGDLAEADQRRAPGSIGVPTQEQGVSPSEEAFWSRLYARGGDGFELGRAAPPLARWFAARGPLTGRTAFNAGCGRGHDARMLARLGALVTAVDLVPEVIAEARALAAREQIPPGRIDFEVGDLFDKSVAGRRYDLFVEHCLFCAIDPARREEWVEVAARLLRPSGRLVGLFWAHGRPGGPPFGVSRPELERLLGARFTLVSVERPSDSVPQRAGEELLIEATLRA